MKYNQALEEISKQYTVNKIALDSAQIITDVLLDEANIICINITKEGEDVILTDYAETINSFDLEEEQIKNICDDYQMDFNDYAIETKYNSIDDLIRYIECMKKIGTLL